MSGLGTGCLCRVAGFWAGSAGLGAGQTVFRDLRDFGRKKRLEILDFVRKLAKLRLGNANKGGGGPKATDPWIKTTKNSANRPNRSNPKWLFLVEIFEFLKNKEKFGGFVVETRSNPWQPRALIPYDAV